MTIIEDIDAILSGDLSGEEQVLAVLRKARKDLDSLIHAVRFAGKAIDTGRSEPLFIARDCIRNTLEDIGWRDPTPETPHD